MASENELDTALITPFQQFLLEPGKPCASKYRLYLPAEAELQALFEADRVRFELDQA